MRCGTPTAIITAIAASDTTKRSTSLFTVRYAAAVSVSPMAATVGVGGTRTVALIGTPGFGIDLGPVQDRHAAKHAVVAFGLGCNARERGTDGDLKCILRGISEDMPKKVEAVQAAATPAERATALSELSYLLNDNVEVITAPPQPEV